jgi:hypothetical protein
VPFGGSIHRTDKFGLCGTTWQEAAPLAALPNLYLKWRVFRSLIGSARSDAQIAKTVFAKEDGAAILFSKLLYGDYGCQPEIAVELVKSMNACIEVHRRDRKMSIEGMSRLIAGDLYLPLHEFTRRLIAASETLEPEKLEGAHRELLAELAPVSGPEVTPRLAIRRFSTDRTFEAMLPSGGIGPVVFEPGRHAGQLAVEGLRHDPIAAYTLVIRDPALVGQWLWEQSWGETVAWLPSPFIPARSGDAINLMPVPQTVKRIPGRFLVTAVLVLDRQTMGELDPRGPAAPSASLDEPQTARFLTNVRRLGKRKNSPIVVARNEYHVVLRDAAQPARA